MSFVRAIACNTKQRAPRHARRRCSTVIAITRPMGSAAERRRVVNACCSRWECAHHHRGIPSALSSHQADACTCRASDSPAACLHRRRAARARTAQRKSSQVSKAMPIARQGVRPAWRRGGFGGVLPSGGRAYSRRLVASPCAFLHHFSGEPTERFSRRVASRATSSPTSCASRRSHRAHRRGAWSWPR